MVCFAVVRQDLTYIINIKQRILRLKHDFKCYLFQLISVKFKRVFKFQIMNYNIFNSHIIIIFIILM